MLGLPGRTVRMQHGASTGFLPWTWTHPDAKQGRDELEMPGLRSRSTWPHRHNNNKVRKLNEIGRRDPPYFLHPEHHDVNLPVPPSGLMRGLDAASRCVNDVSEPDFPRTASRWFAKILFKNTLLRVP